MARLSFHRSVVVLIDLDQYKWSINALRFQEKSVVRGMNIPTVTRFIFQFSCIFVLFSTGSMSEALAAPLQAATVDRVDKSSPVDSSESPFQNNGSNAPHVVNALNSKNDPNVHPGDVVDFYTSMTISEMQDKSLELMAAEHYIEAIESIQQLQGAIHRLYGVDTIEQAESLVWLIECYSALNQYEKVDQQQAFLFSLATRTFDEQDPRYQFARLRLANWYLRSLRYQRALTLYNVISEWAEQERPEDNGDQRAILLMSLRGEALARYVSGKCCASKPMLRVLEITHASDDFDKEDKQDVIQDYVDTLFLEREHVEAGPLLQSLAEEHKATSPILLGYSKMSDMDVEIKRSNHQSTDWVSSYNPNADDKAMVFKADSDVPIVLGDPISICGTQLQKLIKGRNRRRMAALYVDVSMRIDEKGRANDIQMKGNTTAKIRRYLTHAIRKVRFRPGVSSTGEIDSARLEFRQVFTAAAPPSRFRDVSSWSRVLASHSCQLSAL
jgi:hypothetical protein